MPEIAWSVIAVVAGVLPRKLWPRFPSIPFEQTAVPAALLTFALGFVIGVPAFFVYTERAADVNNAWMLRTIPHVAPGDDVKVSTGTFALSALAPVVFLCFTPLGLLTLYLIVTGGLRAVSANADDPRGDPLLSSVHWAATTLWAANARLRRRVARERREGPETPDLLVTGEWAGLKADFVVIASRRKPEWKAGAMILTSHDWYRLGAPVDWELPEGLRTLYPLTKLEAVEVVRRGIQYELPRLSKRPPPKSPPSQV